MTTPAGRLLSLLSLLQTRRDWSGEDLSSRLEVSVRTVRRDVDRLRELGYPVQTTKGPTGGYRLAAGSDLPPMLFDADQAVAVAVALQTAAAGITGIEEASLRALSTIRQVMPSRLRHRVDALQVTAVAGGTNSATMVDAETLLTVGTACRDHEMLRFDYISKVGDRTTRRVEPHRLVCWRRRWYVVAWDPDRDGWRTFRVDRLRPKVPGGPRFTPRELTDEQVSQLLRPAESGWMWDARGKVLLRAPAREASQWIRGDWGVVTARDEHSCWVELGSWTYSSLAAWLLMLDADFAVLEPPELRDALRDLGARIDRALT